MSVQYLCPDGLLSQNLYHHVAVGTGARQVHIAGQVARLPDGTPVATDLAGQLVAVLRNTATALAGVGATFADVVRLTFYVTRWTPDQLDEFQAGIEAAADELGIDRPIPPASLIGVEALYEPDVRVELEATAVLD